MMTKILTVKDYLSNPNRQFIVLKGTEISKEEGLFIEVVSRLTDDKEFALDNCLYMFKFTLKGIELTYEVSIEGFSDDMVHVALQCYIFSEDYRYCAGATGGEAEINDIERYDFYSLFESTLDWFKEIEPAFGSLAL